MPRARRGRPPRWPGRASSRPAERRACTIRSRARSAGVIGPSLAAPPAPDNPGAGADRRPASRTKLDGRRTGSNRSAGTTTCARAARRFTGSMGQRHQVVGVHDLAALLGRRGRGTGGRSARAARRRRTRPRPRATTAPCGPTRSTTSPATKSPVIPWMPGGQQRPAPLQHGGHRAGVQVEAAAHVGGVPQPEPPGRQPPPGRPERGADLRPGRGRRPARADTSSAAASSTGMPDAAAIPAAVILVAMPPVPRLSAPARATLHRVQVGSARPRR